MKQAPLLEVDPHVRRSEDFYATPAYQTRALLRRIRLDGCALVEPCVGDGAIVRELPEMVLPVTTNDIVQRGDFAPDFLQDARKPSSWDLFEAAVPIGVVLTNPPFEPAFEIVQLAYERAAVAVIMLLRLSWLEPTEERGPWLAKHPPTRLIVLPRHDYRGNGKTDSVTSAWMVWSKWERFCAPGVDVVTKDERDELIALGLR